MFSRNLIFGNIVYFERSMGHFPLARFRVKPLSDGQILQKGNGNVPTGTDKNCEAAFGSRRRLLCHGHIFFDPKQKIT